MSVMRMIGVWVIFIAALILFGNLVDLIIPTPQGYHGSTN